MPRSQLSVSENITIASNNFSAAHSTTVFISQRVAESRNIRPRQHFLPTTSVVSGCARAALPVHASVTACW